MASLRKYVRKAGYAGFGYLYVFDEKSRDCAIDENECLRFLAQIPGAQRRSEHKGSDIFVDTEGFVCGARGGTPVDH
jgi:hypothetical protein